MERGHAVTTTIERIMKLLARSDATLTAKSSEIRIVKSDTVERRKMEISSPSTRRQRIRGH